MTEVEPEPRIRPNRSSRATAPAVRPSYARAVRDGRFSRDRREVGAPAHRPNARSRGTCKAGVKPVRPPDPVLATNPTVGVSIGGDARERHAFRAREVRAELSQATSPMTKAGAWPARPGPGVICSLVPGAAMSLLGSAWPLCARSGSGRRLSSDRWLSWMAGVFGGRLRRSLRRAKPGRRKGSWASTVAS